MTLLTVRRDWRDGTHDLQGPHPTEDAALQWIAQDSDRLRSAPVEPTHHVVIVSWPIFMAHRNNLRCSGQHCPTTRPRIPTGAVLLKAEEEDL